MTLTEAIVALTTIAVDQRKQIQALGELMHAQNKTMLDMAKGGLDHEQRLIALESASTITLPPDLVAAIGQVQQPPKDGDEGGTVVPPAIL